MSLATIKVPLKSTIEPACCFARAFNISGIGLSRLIFAALVLSIKHLLKNLAGFLSRHSKNAPSGVIFARIFLCALQETPTETGHEPPCLANLITRASSAIYFPPNWAPHPVSAAILITSSSDFLSLNDAPVLSPFRGKSSYTPAEASFITFKFCSGEVPPTTTTIV